MEVTKSGQVGQGASLKSLRAPVVGVAEVVELDSGAAEATEAAELDAVLSLSVSARSSGCLMAGAASKNLKGSISAPLPKKVTKRVHNSRQSELARAMKRC